MVRFDLGLRGEQSNTAACGPTRRHDLLPHNLTRDLEELKLTLVRMRPDDLETRQFEAIRQEISGIRLQLKRLEFERLAIAEDIRRMNESRENGPQPT